jgi:putative transposase
MGLMFERERTSTELVMYALYLYFLGLSFRNTSRAIEPFEKRSHVAVWEWMQKFNPKHIYPSTRVAAFLIDETMIQIGHNEAWLWVAVEPVRRTVLGVYISRHRNIIVAEAFLRSLIKLYGKRVVYSDGGPWYPDACRTLGLQHRLHSPYEKSIIERAMQYVKDRTECFDDYYPCVKQECNLSHVYKWIDLFVFMHNNNNNNNNNDNATRTDGYTLDDGG